MTGIYGTVYWIRGPGPLPDGTWKDGDRNRWRGILWEREDPSASKQMVWATSPQPTPTEAYSKLLSEARDRGVPKQDIRHWGGKWMR